MFTDKQIRTAAEIGDAAEFGDRLLPLGKTSINHQAMRTALARLANGNVDVQQKLFSQIATYSTRCKDDTTTASGNDKNAMSFDDFKDTMMKLSSCTHCVMTRTKALSSIAMQLSNHCNPAGASGGEQNHKLATQVHSHMRARMGTTPPNDQNTRYSVLQVCCISFCC
jgi:hypothetical protein